MRYADAFSKYDAIVLVLMIGECPTDKGNDANNINSQSDVKYSLPQVKLSIFHVI
ncbi:hypothetical protein SBF1_9710001 [Candidatus Desulfosporosinus infrequens]|uniref:Uncharacterized protein n=1 Tax=Candidatus Desulfosporosinus infrequens TaxID=2043169 RepID=A0A2U3LYI1_9FIRM|nr:hypothetical protein SBF1_9710001 [Candidatus Desulfosporosinus infrequens]